jgi:hypothetical protein
MPINNLTQITHTLSVNHIPQDFPHYTGYSHNTNYPNDFQKVLSLHKASGTYQRETLAGQKK